jgi:hypothetical protein
MNFLFIFIVLGGISYVLAERPDVEPFFLIIWDAGGLPFSFQIEVIKSFAPDEEKNTPASIAAEDMPLAVYIFLESVAFRKGEQAMVTGKVRHISISQSGR